MVQNRWKSKVLWTALGAQVVSLLILGGFIDTGFGDTINQGLSIVLEILVLVGIINNPTDAEKY